MDLKDISIILVGSWNTKIFTPSWMMSELLGLQSNEELEIGFNNNLQPIYKYKQIHFIPTERAFEIRFENISEVTINIANKSALKLISTLPFTPNLVVGFNYKIIGNCDLQNIKIPSFSEMYSLNEVKLYRNEPNFILNVIVNCSDSKTINYNFHYSNLSFIKENAIQEHIDYLKKNGN